MLVYVERNAKRANLVKKAENWKWSSVWRREKGTVEQKKILTRWPITVPNDYLTILNEPQTKQEEEAIRKSIIKGNPYGTEDWMMKMVKKFGLESTLRGVGRPKNGG